MGPRARQRAAPCNWMVANHKIVTRGWWDGGMSLMSLSSAGHTAALFPFASYLMRSFFALIFCGLSLQIGGLAALTVDDDKTVSVNAMLAGLILTAASAPALVVASRRR